MICIKKDRIKKKIKSERVFVWGTGLLLPSMLVGDFSLFVHAEPVLARKCPSRYGRKAGSTTCEESTTAGKRNQ